MLRDSQYNSDHASPHTASSPSIVAGLAPAIIQRARAQQLRPHGPASLVQRLIDLRARRIHALPNLVGRCLGIRVDPTAGGGVAAASEGRRGRCAGVMLSTAQNAGARRIVGVISLLATRGGSVTGAILVAAEQVVGE